MGTLAENAAAVKAAQVAIDAAIVAKGGTTDGGLTNAAAAIGQMQLDDEHYYAWRNDGKSHIWVEIDWLNSDNDPDYYFYLTFSYKGTDCYVDWGDGSEVTELADMSSMGNTTVSHNYTSIGRYVITISTDVIHCGGGGGVSNIANAAYDAGAAAPSRYIRQCAAIRQIELHDVTGDNNHYSFMLLRNARRIRAGGDYANPFRSYKFSESGFKTIEYPYPQNDVAGAARTFSGCWNLEALPNIEKLTSYGSNMFYELKSVKEFVIPDSFSGELATSVFARSSNQLKRIVIGSGVTKIGVGSFQVVGEGKTFVVRAVVPPTLGDNNSLIYGGPNSISDYTIYVPTGTLEAYKAAWSDYAEHIVEGGDAD